MTQPLTDGHYWIRAREGSWMQQTGWRVGRRSQGQWGVHGFLCALSDERVERDWEIGPRLEEPK